ncbi:MAG: hypothetical protein LBN30_01190 [Oscillospiraceae bacterium]|nr:hypothetical protein [Oscillospiraceae bacterium]
MHDSERIVEIWLTNGEKSDLPLRETLKPVYSEYKARKYTVAVFESGGGALFDGTRDLLLHNRTG